jgi:threonine aldolase
MNFTSDNSYGVAEPVMQAIIAANRGPAASYGGDEWTARVVSRFRELFEREVEVHLVASGTAANAIGIASLVPPHGAVLCHAESHIYSEECGACEFYSSGARLAPVEGFAGKMTPDGLRRALARFPGLRNDLVASAVSLTEASECGTLYRPDEIVALARIAHGTGLGVHMDGARFANAVAALGVSPADLTWRAGVDVMSFGATKNGAMAAEAVIVFDAARVRDLPFRRKRGGHVLSKLRFLAAQLEACLTDGLWLGLAAHANAMAARLAAGLGALEPVRLPWPTEANEVFALMPKGVAEALRARGAAFHDWTTVGLAGTRWEPGAGECLVRLVASFATAEGDVDSFLALASELTA